MSWIKDQPLLSREMMGTREEEKRCGVTIVKGLTITRINVGNCMVNHQTGNLGANINKISNSISNQIHNRIIQRGQTVAIKL